MVIDYEKNPLLKKCFFYIKEGHKYNSFKSQEDADFFKLFSEIQHNINFVTNTFYDSVSENSVKLIESFISDENFLSVGGVFFTKQQMYFVKMDNSGGRESRFNGEVYLFDTKSGNLIAFYNKTKTWLSNNVNLVLMNVDRNKFINSLIRTAVSIALFKKYAQIETKTLFKKRKTIINSEKNLNNTDFDITYLDNTWFTNLIKSEGFDVRGHFRLQPIKKNGEWTKELIWINKFKKEGYNRKAKKTIA